MRESSRTHVSSIATLNPDRVAVIEKAGGDIRPLEPIGAAVYGIDLRSEKPPEPVIRALEAEMANRGLLVFKDQQQLSADELIKASVWWGAQQMHSTHGVHPATPGLNGHIFRLSNDQRHGILGVGPLFHNDGAFCEAPFSHVAYHIIRVPEQGGGTVFAHQGLAFHALPEHKQAYWQRLTSVNSASGVAHPVVHTHPVSGMKSVWLHLGMTGAVIEKLADEEGFRLLEEAEMRQLFHDYNDLLNAGIENGYTLPYEYEPGDCVFIDNYAVAHRAAPGAREPASSQGLRIMHRATIKAPYERFPPRFGLPQYLDIRGPNPLGQGVWHAGGIGFRWDDEAHMQN